MKGAIMQPYFFPYIGYYQLAYEVEKFIFLDDVNFIKKGYINRNAILLQEQRHEFSAPVSKISQNRHINDHHYTGDFEQFLSLIEQAYKKSKFFADIFPIIQSVALDTYQNVARKNAASIVSVFEYLGLKREFSFSSGVEIAAGIKGQDRIIKLCEIFGFNKYRNSIGGESLYSQEKFSSAGIELKFIESNIQPYPQGKHEFVSHLSMIDVLMHCDKQTIRNQLASYSLI